jgi:hypothetical protein
MTEPFQPGEVSQPFDAYYELLGIPPAEQPPTLYRLLGLSTFESNSKVIERSADRQMSHLRSFKTGEPALAAQILLSEVAKASRVLLTPEEKAPYDAALQRQQAAGSVVPMGTLVVHSPMPLTPVAVAPGFPVPASVSYAPEWAQPNMPPAFGTLNTQSQVGSSNSNSMVLLIAGAAGLVVVLVVVAAIALSGGNKETLADADTQPAPPSPTKDIHTPPTPPVGVVVPPTPISPLTNVPIVPSPPAASGQPIAESASQPMAAAAPAIDAPADQRDQPGNAKVVATAPAQAAAAVDPAEVRREIDAAKAVLREHPKFARYYEHFDTTPDSIGENGPKLAKILWHEVGANKTISEHPPSFAAAMEEVERLALAGGDFRQALQAIDARRNLGPAGLSDRQAVHAKANALAEAAKIAGEPRGTPEERVEVKTWILDLLRQSLTDGDEESALTLVPALGHLSRSTSERFETSTQIVPSIEEALATEQPEIAGKLLEQVDSLLKSAFGKGRKEVVERLEPLRERYKVSQKASEARRRLEKAPDDPEANLTYGLYLLEVREEWEESLPHLAKASDEKLKELAAATIVPPTKASDKAVLADRWAAAGEKRPALLHPARRLYAQALMGNELAGIARAAAEAKASKLGPEKLRAVKATASGKPVDKKLPLKTWIDLLPLVRLPDDSVLGNWALDGRGLSADARSPAKLKLPLKLANCSYDLQVEFQSEADPHNVNVMLPVGDRSVLVVGDGYVDAGCVSNFALVRGKDPLHLPGSVRGPMLFANTRYKYDISVRLQGGRAKLSLALNDKPMFGYDGPVADLQIIPAYRLADQGWLGLASWQSAITFLSCKVRLEEGPGEFTRIETRHPWTSGAVLALSFDIPTHTLLKGRAAVRDVSGHDNHGFVQGLTRFSNGHSGLSAVFDRPENFVECLDSPSLRPGAALTMAAWFYADKWVHHWSHGTLISKDEWDGDSSGYVLRCGGEGNVNGNVHSSGGWHPATTRKTFPEGVWHHAVATCDGKRMTVYVNGQVEAFSYVPGPIDGSNFPLRIGANAYDTNRHFVGWIDEVALWDRALSAEEVQSLYAFSRGGQSYCAEIEKAAKK